MKHLACAAVAISFLASLAVSQSMSVSLASAVVLQATCGAQTQSVTIPAGPLLLPACCVVGAGTTGNAAMAQVCYGISPTTTQPQARFDLAQDFWIQGSVAAQSSLGPSEFLVTLQAPTPTPALLDITRVSTAAGIGIVPSVSVDVNDDGVLELVGGASTELTVHVTLVPGGVPVRVRTQNHLVTPASVSSHLTLALRPANTAVTRIASGCLFGDQMVVDSTFTGDVLLGKHPTPSPFWLPVIGFGIQPTALPAPPATCLLLPSPDFVLFTSIFTPQYVLTVPPAVRPIRFWTQSVSLLPLGGFATGATFRIDAL